MWKSGDRRSVTGYRRTKSVKYVSLFAIVAKWVGMFIAMGYSDGVSLNGRHIDTLQTLSP